MALKFLFKMLKFDRYLFIYTTFAFAASVCGVYTVILLGGIVKSVTGENADFQSFLKVLTTYVVVTLTVDLLEFISVYTGQKVFPKIGSRSSEYFYKKIMKNSVNFILENNSGYIASHASKLYGDVSQLFSNVFHSIFMCIALFIICILTMAYYVPEVAVAIIVLSIFFSYLYYKRVDFIREAYKVHNKNNSKFSASVVDIISNVLLVKSFNGERHEDKQFNSSLSKLQESNKKCIKSDAIATLLHYCLHGSFVMITVGYCAYLVFQNQIDISTFVILNGLSMRCGWYLNRLMSGVRAYKRITGNITQALEVMNKEIEIKDSGNAKELKIKNASIQIECIDFKYKDNTDYIFKGFSLDIKSGEKVGLIGYSGGGKSSLVKLIQRFSDLDGGCIKFDGKDISKVTQESLREKVSYISQEPSLFSRSVYDNIAYAKPNATKEEVYKAAELANADEFIKELPEGYETKVGERGFKLSGGQKQRIAIARVILKDAPIIIMDEATSALDMHSEKLIQKSLENLMKDKTCIVIAHRLSTIKNMDRIVVLDKGQIAQEGSHLSLVRKEGIYKKLWNMQFEGILSEDKI